MNVRVVKHSQWHRVLAQSTNEQSVESRGEQHRDDDHEDHVDVL